MEGTRLHAKSGKLVQELYNSYLKIKVHGQVGLRQKFSDFTFTQGFHCDKKKFSLQNYAQVI
jgi:hypothetical protein